MKIAYLSDALIPSERANSIHVMKMCAAFKSLGHEVTLYGLKSDRNTDVFKFYGVKPFELKLNGFKIPKLRILIHAFLMALSVKQRRFDIVFGRSLFGCYLAARLGVKVCYETHDPVSTLDKKRRYIFNKLIKSENFIGLVVMSEALKFIIQNEITKMVRILAVHDGASFNDFHTKQKNNIKWPAKLGRPQIGYVGTISNGRGIEVILQTAAILKDFDFHIIGGNKNDLTKLENKEYHNCNCSNVFFHGFLPPSTTVLAREKCDVLLAPYQSNITIRSGKQTSQYMSPLKIFEYMASGKPIVASDLPVLREVLTHGQNCLLANPKNVQEWKDNIKFLITNEDSANSLSQAAEELLKSEYTWEKRADKILNFINT